MMRYIPEELFEVNRDLKIKIIDLGNGDKALSIDNFYKNPYDIRNLILNSPVPMWKNTPDGLNWKEYYDCRHQLGHNISPFSNAMYELISHFFQKEYLTLPYAFISNVFQWIIDQPKNSIGNRVHAD